MAYRSTSRVKAKKGKGPINYEVFPQTRQVVSVEELLAAVEIDSEMVGFEPTRAQSIDPRMHCLFVWAACFSCEGISPEALTRTENPNPSGP